MGKRRESTILLLVDLLTVSGAWAVYFLVRVRSGWISVAVEPDFWQPMVFVYFFWLLVFWIVGLYRPWYAASRVDELVLLFKATIFGCFFLFFVIFMDDEGQSAVINSRVLIALYWALLFGFVGTGRMLLRRVQRQMLVAGIGAHNTLIVGSAAGSRELYEKVRRFPGLGYRVVGFVRLDRRKPAPEESGLPVLGSIDDLPSLIPIRDIRQVLIALDSQDHDRLLDIIAKCSSHQVGLKIVPDLYDIISGQARTNQIYGFPLIEISPQLMPPWEEATKRMIDVAVAGLVLALSSPLWILIAAAIKLDSPGSVFYKQERVGRESVIFKMLKFRSMRQDAEKAGPQWAHKKDPRVTRIGRILRKLHFDELPQMINVLNGQMSLVGPRPERPVFVEKLSKEIPLYSRRLRVRPGITGWAQVRHKYDESIEDVRKKVEYDLFYIENMSLRMDFKILFNTIAHMLLWRGH
jgi:exopolysaccharide biosynthesis polyprenyl glycosylphosphotransferase